MSAKNLQKILQLGTLLSFLTILLVSSGFLFPYITSKQLVFNVIIELLLPIYLILLWRYPQYRPKRNLVGYGLIAYLLAILLSSFFSVDFNLSFWGGAERMLGWFHLSHYFMLYFYLLAAWRSQKDWNIVLSSFVLIAVVQALFYLSGDNRIGNTAYLSAYLLFNIFLALILYIKTFNIWRYIWLATLIPLFLAFYQARTSGAFFGLAFAVFLLLFLLTIFWQKRAWRLWTGGVLVFLVIVIIALFSQSQADWFQEHRLLRGLTFDKPTFQTRLVSWEGAVKEFSNQPILGIGYGNYALIFDKQFDSRFLDYTRTSTYFDRAHNNLIDITATTGLVGLITYLSIFVALLYYLWHLLKERGFVIAPAGRAANRSKEILFLLALLSAYFVQNLAVFDTQVTYLSLMIVLAYIVFLAESELKFKRDEQETKQDFYAYYPLSPVMKFGLLLITVFSLILISINYRSATLFSGVIDAYTKIVHGQVEEGLDKYQEIIEINSPIKRDVRSILINFFIQNSQVFSSLSTERLLKEINYVISLAEENLDYNIKDTKANLNLSQVLDVAARLTKGTELATPYSERALEAIDRAIESSPGRAPLYFSKAQILLGLERYQEVQETIEYAILLNKNLADGYCHLAQINLALEDRERAYDYLDQCLDRKGSDKLSSDSLLIEGLEYYKQEADYEKALLIINRLAELKPEEAAVYFELTKIHLYLGNQAESVAAAQKLVELEEGINDPAAIYIQLANEELTAERINHSILAAEIAVYLDPSLEESLNEFIEALAKERIE